MRGSDSVRGVDSRSGSHGQGDAVQLVEQPERAGLGLGEEGGELDLLARARAETSPVCSQHHAEPNVLHAQGEDLLG